MELYELDIHRTHYVRGDKVWIAHSDGRFIPAEVVAVYPGSPNKRKGKVDFNGASRYSLYSARMRENFKVGKDKNHMTLGSEQLWPRHDGETSPIERIKKFLKEHPEYAEKLHRTSAPVPKKNLGENAGTK